MKFLFVLLLSFSSFHLYSSQVQKDVSLINYEELEKRIEQEKDKFLVLNFWSTTCGPCVKELPHFVTVNKEFREKNNFRMLLVSLDRAADKQKVINFIKQKNIEADVVILDDIKRMNTWIPRFQEDWEGEIPVTLFYDKGQKVYFHNGDFTLEQLKNTLQQFYKL